MRERFFDSRDHIVVVPEDRLEPVSVAGAHHRMVGEPGVLPEGHFPPGARVDALSGTTVVGSVGVEQHAVEGDWPHCPRLNRVDVPATQGHRREHAAQREESFARGRAHLVRAYCCEIRPPLPLASVVRMSINERCQKASQCAACAASVLRLSVAATSPAIASVLPTRRFRAGHNAAKG